MIIDKLEEEAREDLEEEAREDLEEDLEEEIKEELKCIRQLALIAAGNVKSLSDQLVTNLFTAMIVLGRMRVQGQAGLIGLAERILAEKNLEEGVEIEEDPISKTGKCMKQPALSAEKDVKSLLSQLVTNLFTAMIALVKAKAGMPNQKDLTNPMRNLRNLIKSWIRF